jgi:hypothetical protein
MVRWAPADGDGTGAAGRKEARLDRDRSFSL